VSHTQSSLTLTLEVSQQVPTEKRSQPIYERTSEASLITSLLVRNGWTVDGKPITTGVALRDS